MFFYMYLFIIFFLINQLFIYYYVYLFTINVYVSKYFSSSKFRVMSWVFLTLT